MCTPLPSPAQPLDPDPPRQWLLDPDRREQGYVGNPRTPPDPRPFLPRDRNEWQPVQERTDGRHPDGRSDRGLRKGPRSRRRSRSGHVPDYGQRAQRRLLFTQPCNQRGQQLLRTRMNRGLTPVFALPTLLYSGRRNTTQKSVSRPWRTRLGQSSTWRTSSNPAFFICSVRSSIRTPCS